MSNSIPHIVSHRLIIEDISHKLLDAQEYPCFTSSSITCPICCTYSSFTNDPPEYALQLYPKGANDNSKDYLSVGLYSNSYWQYEKCLLRCQFSLIDSEEQKTNTKEWSYCFLSRKSCTVFDRFITQSDLLNPANGFVRDDKLTIDCQITILGEMFSVRYFHPFVSDLHFIAESNPELMVEMFHSLALEKRNKVTEFPERVPLDLHLDGSLEETLTYHAKDSLSHKWKISNGTNRDDYLTPICAKEDSSIKFTLHYNCYDHDQLSIFFLSTPNIFVNLTAYCTTYCQYIKRRKYLLNKRVSRELSTVSRFIKLRLTKKCRSCKNVKIDLEMTIYKESSRKYGFPEMKSLSREQLLLDLKSIFEGGKHCDVVLLVEGKQFRAHKAILANRSMVFEAMFSHDMKEKLENRVEVHDVTVQVFEQFLLYLYTGIVNSEILKIHAMDLFVLADMHYLSILQEMCLRMFGQSLTPESVAELFELADRLGLIELKQVCTDYMNMMN